MSDWREDLIELIRARTRNSEGVEHAPSIKKRNLTALVRSIEEIRALPDLSPADRQAACQIVRRVIADIPDRKGGRPKGITNNPAATGFSLAEQLVETMLAHCPQLDPEKQTKGRGNVGYVGAVEACARMIRDAEPAAGTAPQALEERRRLFGSDEQLSRIRESKRRVKRRAKAQGELR